MSYILINYGLNKNYNIHKHVFFQVVKDALKKNKAIELAKEPEIVIVEKNTNLEINLELKIKKDSNLEIVINDLSTNINEQIKALIGVLPKNIQINYKGRTN